MHFRLFSDLHHEFSHYELTPLDTDKDDVLILAGDIGVGESIKTFDPVIEWAKRFRKVIHICGNHEYYHGSLLRVRDKIKLAYAGSENIVHAHNEVVRVDDVSFICATLWTDFNKRDPVAAYAIEKGLNDYKLIRTGTIAEPYKHKISAPVIMKEHDASRKFIFANIVAEKAAGQKTVVVSHHAPTTLSVHPMYGNDILNWAYVSDLSNQILDTNPDLMVHGHTHTSFDYMVGNTRVIANPRGYARNPKGSENRTFDHTLRIEVKNYGV